MNPLFESGIIKDDNTVNSNYKKILKSNHQARQTLFDLTPFVKDQTSSSYRERLYCVLNNISEHPVCECNTQVPFSNAKKRYNEFCSDCRYTSQKVKNRIKQSFMDKYGVDNPAKVVEVKQKKKVTNKQRYGTDFPLQSEEIKSKAKQTMLKRYGVEHALQSEKIKKDMEQSNMEKFGVKQVFQSIDIQDKIKQTIKEKYGVSHISQVSEVQDKIKQTMMKRYDVDHYKQQTWSQETIDRLNDKQWCINQHHDLKKSLLQISEELSVHSTTVQSYFHKHEIEIKWYFRSAGEKQLNEFIQSLGIETQPNIRSIIPHELDVYIPSHNLAIEYCGLYWHSEQQGKDKHYHRNKYDLCKEKGIQLITIFEDEWVDRQEQVKAKLKALLNKDDRQKIYARNTKIVEVSTKTKKAFFEQNHIQGDGPGSINIGLTHDNKLVACMSFIKQKNDNYILNRYATSGRVVGGFSKLLKHFKDKYTWTQITSFADLRWSSGNLYQKTGWTLQRELLPDYFYIRHNKRIHKFNYRRKNLPKLIKHFDPTLSEKQNCDINGVLRVWDCGKLRFVLSN